MIGAALLAAGTLAAVTLAAESPPIPRPFPENAAESVEWDLEGREALLPHRETGAELEFRRHGGGLRRAGGFSPRQTGAGAGGERA